MTVQKAWFVGHGKLDQKLGHLDVLVLVAVVCQIWMFVYNQKTCQHQHLQIHLPRHQHFHPINSCLYQTVVQMLFLCNTVKVCLQIMACCFNAHH